MLIQTFRAKLLGKVASFAALLSGWQPVGKRAVLSVIYAPHKLLIGAVLRGTVDSVAADNVLFVTLDIPLLVEDTTIDAVSCRLRYSNNTVTMLRLGGKEVNVSQVGDQRLVSNGAGRQFGVARLTLYAGVLSRAQ
jgi:hypothetical protein